MVLKGLSESLRGSMRKLANAPHIDRSIITEVSKEIQRALITADVNINLVFQLTNSIKDRALSEKPPAGMTSREHVINIVYQELVNILGESREIPLKPQIIMMVGLYGQGKTTTSGKLARYFQKKGMRPALIAGDVHRPAAFDQLSQLGKMINAPVYGDPKKKNAVKIVKAGLKQFRKDHDIIIIDTSGRHSLEKELIKEIKNIHVAANPTEKFLVLDAQVGQQAGPQAKAFHEAVGVTGVVITKMDGTAKGGGALSAVSETQAPVVFIGTGERINELEQFDPSRFISRLLGMGDIKSLLEAAVDNIDEEKAEETARHIMSGKFTLKDMAAQLEMVGKMGTMDKIMDMLPFGMGKKKIPDMALGASDEKLARFKVIMSSMTEDELVNPRIIKSSRIQRVAMGSGSSPEDVRELLKHYKRTKKMMKTFMGNRKMRRQLMKKFNPEDFDLSSL